MRLPTVLVVAAGLCAALVTGCSDDEATRPDETPTASGSATATADPFRDLAPPNSPGVGNYDPVIANRAYATAHGLLAFQLLERDTLIGRNDKALAEQLGGEAQDLTVAKDLSSPPTARGLDYRPRFAPTVTVGAAPAKVERSIWTADEVMGRGGERALRVTWDGAIRYTVAVAGQPVQMAYAMTFSYVFTELPNEPNGLRMVTAIKGRTHIAQVDPRCTTKGLLLPFGAPSEADFGAGPYTPGPAPTASGPCPA